MQFTRATDRVHLRWGERTEKRPGLMPFPTNWKNHVPVGDSTVPARLAVQFAEE